MATRTLITGGGRGLGLALVEAALARGHRVAATVRDPARAEALQHLQAQVGDALVVGRFDAADSSQVGTSIADLAEQLGGLDLIINSAGVNAITLPDARSTLALETLQADPLLDMMRINVAAPLLVVQAALPWLRASDNPRVVNISSWIGSIGGTTYSGNYAYAASKAALNMASRLMANELREDGIVVVAMNPGWVQTGMGGQRAELTPAQSAEGIVTVAESLDAAQSGRFMQWDGTEHVW